MMGLAIELHVYAFKAATLGLNEEPSALESEAA